MKLDLPFKKSQILKLKEGVLHYRPSFYNTYFAVESFGIDDEGYVVAKCVTAGKYQVVADMIRIEDLEEVTEKLTIYQILYIYNNLEMEPSWNMGYKIHHQIRKYGVGWPRPEGDELIPFESTIKEFGKYYVEIETGNFRQGLQRLSVTVSLENILKITSIGVVKISKDVEPFTLETEFEKKMQKSNIIDISNKVKY